MTQPTLTLTGYRYSVYTRAVRMALWAKGVGYTSHEVDPFDPDQLAGLAHPFDRVPVLSRGSFRLYETQAILDYIDLTWPEPPLSPTTVQGRARMRQVMGIADAYAYKTLVRQLVSETVFAALEGQASDADALAQGMRDAPRILSALDEIAAEGHVLTGQHLSLADCLLWPMIDYFMQTPDAALLLRPHAALLRWATAMMHHPAAQATRPDLQRYSA